MNAELWRRLCALAEQQHGLVSTRQLTALGVSPSGVASARASGRLFDLRRGVLRVAGSPPSPWQALSAALLTTDGVASHRAAAGLFGFPGVKPGAVEVTVFDSVTPRLRGVTAHRSSVLVADDITVASGLAVTSPARTLVDLAGCADLHTTLLARMIDDCSMRRLCRPSDVDECLARCETRRGRRRLLTLLDQRVRTDSHLEAQWLRRLRQEGLAPPAVGYQLVVDGRVMVLDFAWPEDCVGIEVDGWRPHASRGAFDRDRLRDLAAVRVGWTILRVTSRTPPAELYATLRPLVSQ